MRSRKKDNHIIIKQKNGFTLIELIVVIAIIGVLASVLMPSFSGFINVVKQSADKANLKILNNATSFFKAEVPTQDPFLDVNRSSSDLMTFLVDSGFLPSVPIPKQKDTEFKWDFTNEIWFISGSAGEIELVYTPGEYFSFNSSVKSIFGYDGKGGTDLVIPKEINGVYITQIGQSAMYHGYNSNTWDKLTSVLLPDKIQRISGNAFHSNSLTSIDIPDSVTYLGANAFYGNLLTSVSLGSGITEIKGGTFASNRITEIVIPSGIKTIGDGAFQSNAITKVTIGENVTLTKSTSLGNYGGSFNSFYTSEGQTAGTYIYENGKWSAVNFVE